MKSLLLRALWSALALLSVTAGLRAQPTFTGLTMINPTGASNSYGVAINASGQVLVRGDNYTATLWSAGNSTQITNGFYSSGEVSLPERGALNNSGQVVGYALDAADENRYFVWSSGSGMTEVSVGDISEVQAINNSGSVVGQAANNGFVWNNGSTTALTTPYNNGSYAYAVNSSGQVAGRAYDSDWNSVAVRWESKCDMTLIGDIGMGFVGAINDSGHVVGGNYDIVSGSSRATYWDGTTTTSLGALGATDDSYAYGINNLGDVVGNNEGGQDEAFLYTSGAMYNLNTLSASYLVPQDGSIGFTRLISAIGINDAGQIVGIGLYFDGTDVYDRAFFLNTATAVPEPSTYAMILGGAALGFVMWRRRRTG
jgi:probable HAF family extracellular repeat protein